MTLRSLFALVVICCTQPVAAWSFEPVAADEQIDSATAPASATRDLLYFQRDRPVFLRLHVVVDGESFDAPWRRHVADLFAHADSDSNGQLTEDELTKIPDGPRELTAILRRPDLLMADSAPFDGAISVSELESFLSRRDRGPFQPLDQPETGTTGAAVNVPPDALFDGIDRDGDGRLSAAEFGQAMETMHRRDLDDDGAISTMEAAFASGRVAVQRTSEEQLGRPFVLLEPGTSPAAVVRQLIRRYGSRPRQDAGSAGNSDLSARELGMAADLFARWDLDASGKLDIDELRRLVKSPEPTLELTVRLGKRNEEPVVSVLPGYDASGLTVRSTSELVSVVIGDVQIEIGELRSGEAVAKRYLLQQFKASDRDNNGYLEDKELRANSVFAASFNQFDTDADGQLFENELVAVVDERAEAARSQTRMRIEDRGRNLFQILDADRNGRLNAGELADGASRIGLWDNDGDGVVGSDEVPRMYQLSLGPGQPVFRGVRIPGMPGVRREARQAGPAWFQKMDRNGDGQLVRREFPGSRAEYQRLDRNGDGLVLADEAIEAEQSARKKTPPGATSARTEPVSTKNEADSSKDEQDQKDDGAF